MVWCLGDKIVCAKSPHSTRSCVMSQYYVCINRPNLKLLSARGGRFLADFFPAKCCFLNDNKQPLQASPLTLKLKLWLKIHEKCAPSTLSGAVLLWGQNLCLSRKSSQIPQNTGQSAAAAKRGRLKHENAQSCKACNDGIYQTRFLVRRGFPAEQIIAAR